MSVRASHLLFTAALVLSACATAPDPTSATSAPDSGVRIVVAPMNLSIAAPEEIADGEARVWREILDYFQARGGEVAVLAPESAERLWRAATADVEESHRGRALVVARSRFAQELAAHRDFDLVVLPSLVLRPGRMHGDFASWDGVSRRVPDSGASASRSYGDVLGAGAFLQVVGLRGNVAGVSLHVSVLRSDGSAAFEGMGGLDVVQELKRDTAPDGGWVFATRDDPFSEPANLREGVARAFGHQLLATREDR